MKRVIVLPNGHQVTLGEYVRSWKAIQALHESGQGRRLVANWGHFPTAASEILGAIRRGVMDRINIRGGLVIREDRGYWRRWHKAVARGKVVRRCGWCGTEFRPAKPMQACCSDDCFRSWRS